MRNVKAKEKLGKTCPKSPKMAKWSTIDNFFLISLPLTLFFNFYFFVDFRVPPWPFNFELQNCIGRWASRNFFAKWNVSKIQFHINMSGVKFKVSFFNFHYTLTPTPKKKKKTNFEIMFPNVCWIYSDIQYHIHTLFILQINIKWKLIW